MAFVTAGPNEYLVVGEGGKLANRGTAVRTFLWPGAVYVLVPSTRQETTFEMTQESLDGIPLRFKGIVIYRIKDPIAASQQFDFLGSGGPAQINALLTHICLGELRSTVSHMTMQDCIEERKTKLTPAVEGALRQVIGAQGEDPAAPRWGIDLELVQVAQVFIVDNELRKQLEAEVRNEIRLKSDQSNIRSQEEVKTAQITSEQRFQERKLEFDKENLRRKEDLELAQATSDQRLREKQLEADKAEVRRKEEIELSQVAYRRRMKKETLETERAEIVMEREKFRLQQEAAQERIETETPVRLLRSQKEREALDEELQTKELEVQVKEREVQAAMMLETARQRLRAEILPLEQAPALVEAATQIFQGTNLSLYGSEGQFLAQLEPLFRLVTGLLHQADQSRQPSESERPA